MSFVISCPNCGPRDIYEFRFGGEVKVRPDENSTGPAEWAEYVYVSRNEEGFQKEWWHHSKGCGCWFTLWRDTRDNLPVRVEVDLA
ncbi:MAG: sarcosine oxidase subunit delta [Deltaproteobacteria bacterium]|nr:sarcosine oxidase subunit delta [Deltaproteobacteria bacterium]